MNASSIGFHTSLAYTHCTIVAHFIRYISHNSPSVNHHMMMTMHIGESRHIYQHLGNMRSTNFNDNHFNLHLRFIVWFDGKLIHHATGNTLLINSVWWRRRIRLMHASVCIYKQTLVLRMQEIKILKLNLIKYFDIEYCKCAVTHHHQRCSFSSWFYAAVALQGSNESNWTDGLEQFFLQTSSVIKPNASLFI